MADLQAYVPELTLKQCNILILNCRINVDVFSTNTAVQSAKSSYLMTISCLESCPSGTMPLSIKAVGYGYQAKDNDFMMSISTE